MNIKLHSKAPVRIDLAGGTLDIWPLFLLIEKPVTVNLAIDLFAEAWLEEEDGNGTITLASEDQKTEIQFSWRALHETEVGGPLILPWRLLRYFMDRSERDLSGRNLTIRTRARSPAGAGLGGSSALCVAIIGVLSKWAKGSQSVRDSFVATRSELEQFIHIVQDTESQVLFGPAGLQDYYGAAFGGLQRIQWATGGHQQNSLPQDIISGLEDRLILFYSGLSRNSGINNWQVFKDFIDRKNQIQERLGRIGSLAQELSDALSAQDWLGARDAISQEWEVRRLLATGISTPEMDQALERAEAVAPIAFKVCGAGGGGCFFIYVADPNPETKQKIIHQVMTIPGIRHLPFKSVPHGLQVENG